MKFKKKILFSIALLTFAYCDQPLGELKLSSSTNKKTSFSFKLNDNFESISEGINYNLNYFIQVNNSFTPDLKYTVKSDYVLDKKFVSQFEFGISKNKEIKYSNPAVGIHDVYEINGNNYLHLRISPIQKFGNKTKVLDNIHIELNGIHNPIILDSENIAILLNEQNNDKNPVLMIIAPDGQNIYNLMTPLINWKKMKGFEVLYYELSDVGYTSSAIKNFIQNAHDTWDNPPNYLCIVGDADGPYAVPTFNENLSVYNGETDLPYTLVSGNDYISDLAIGRLSVRSLSELANVINKIINYEQYPFVDGTNWFQRGLCVGDSSISGSSTVITNQLIAELMLKNNMNEVVEVYQYPFVNQIQNVINSGVAFYNYRGFAGSSGWDKDGADELSNGYMLPVVSVITCDTGSFLNDEQSIAENFLRAGTISIPKGGIAGIGMSTQGTHTMFNNCLDYGLYHGIFSEKIEFLGDVVNFAKNNLRLNYPDNPNNYVDIFSHWINLMGDPTLSIWTTQPKNLTANYDHSIDFGQNQLEVIVSSADDLIKRARVTMTDNNFNLVASGLTDDSGHVLLSWEHGVAGLGDYNIVITKRNFIPLKSTVEIMQSNISLNVVEFEIFNDSNSYEIFAGDEINLSFKVENFGLSSLSNIEGGLEIDDQMVSLDQNNFNISQLPNGEQSNTINIGGFINSESFAKEINGSITLSFENDSWTFPFSKYVGGPDIELISYSDSDGNNFLTSGNNELYFRFVNSGTLSSNEMIINLQTTSEYLSNDEIFINIPTLLPSQEYISPAINLIVNGNIITGTTILFDLLFFENDNLLCSKNTQLVVGEKSSDDVQGPDSYGYYIYDNHDSDYEHRPDYDWIEVDPYFDGIGTILMDLNDNGDDQDDVTFVNMPFTFTFYGKTYDQISISSNGWIKPGLTNQSSFRNWRMPGPGGPSPMIAAFWDDLKTGPGRICVDYDSSNHWYIIEWSNVQNSFNNSPETFQVIIFDENYYPTPTGDNIIKIQYKEFNNVNSGHYEMYNQWHGNYASIGIEDESSLIGIEYSWNNEYAVEATPITNESAILISTVPPQIISILTGDINQDNALNILDIVQLVHQIVNQEITPITESTGDLNNDFSINVLDVVFLLNLILEN